MADIDFSTRNSVTRISISGALTVHGVTTAAMQVAKIAPEGRVIIDLERTTHLDSGGAWLVNDIVQKVATRGGSVQITGADPAASSILETVSRAMHRTEADVSAQPADQGALESIGRVVSRQVSKTGEIAAFLGLVVASVGRTLARPREFRLTSLVHHCEEVGIRAVPIVALMAFLIGVVLAFQGASQLRQFGAEVFVVDLIAVSILRELGILLTAIIVAGRTASAFTAAIGSMKMREEIDAMRTLGLDPAMTLFVPRVLALLLMLPILGLIANLAGLFGGALMAWIELGISPAMFQARLIEGTALSNVIVGLAKAPVFALIIGVVGCYAGMQVGNNAESLGQMTSKAVVAAIFAVIVADALFSVFFAEIGL